MPWPSAPAGVNPENYPAYDHTPNQFPPVRPANWAQGGGNWKLTSARSTNQQIDMNPQELCGVRGNGVDTAWPVTTGRPTTVIAITDSGIEWCDPGIVNKIFLNRAALPLPENAQGLTKPELQASGVAFSDKDPYDLLGSGVLNVAQYTSDPRVLAVAKGYGGLFCSRSRGSYPAQPGLVSPEDLIRAFGVPTLPSGAANPYYYGRSGPTGFTEAIAGWNFLDNSNNPYDDVHYDHGTGEAKDSTGAANSPTQEVGTCPSCMVLPIRVGDSFIASANAFAQGVMFAVDSGASVVQEALGTYNITDAARQAIGYAQAHGVPVVASAADEEAQHHNAPAVLAHTIVVNSTTNTPTANGVPIYNPPSYLYLNGCTNYGANIAVTVESASCSSEAAGKTGGIVGLAESAAADAMAKGTLKPYPGLMTVTGQAVALSANEIRQLVTMAASAVNFKTAALPYGPPDNNAVVAPVPTTRYPSQPGFDIYTGYGRIDAARMMRWVAAGRIPPQAEISSPGWFHLYSPAQTLTLRATVGTTRAKSWRYQVDVAPGAQPAPGTWRLVHLSATESGIRHVTTNIPLSEVAAMFPASVRASGFTGGPVGAGGRSQANRFTFSVRVVVQDVSHGATRGMIGMARRAEFLHADPTLLAGYPRRLPSSIDAPPTLAPLGPGRTNVLLVATSGGTVHALLPNGHELPGWPVHTAALPYHSGEPAFISRAVTAVPRGEIIGGVAVGDLAHAGGNQPDVVATDLAGRVYAWDAQGELLPGFPVQTNPAFSSPAARNAQNRLLPGILAAPALADLTGNGQLDIVASSMDRHVYAWQPDARPVPGWPVLVVDPSQVSVVNPVTNQVTFKTSSGVTQGSKLIDTPAIGNLNGATGPPDVVVGANEEYLGPVNASIANPLNTALGAAFDASGLLPTANSRVYAIYPSGAGHALAAGAPNPLGFPDPGAFLPGWPAPVGVFDSSLLPVVGDGVTGSPALADLGGNGRLEVGVAASAGPGYVLAPNGTSYLGTGPDGKSKVLSTQPSGALSNSVGSVPSIPALGMPVFSPLGGGPLAPGVSMVLPALSLGKALDVALPGKQYPHDNQVDAWSVSPGAAQGHFDTAFPQVMGDMQFLVSPIVADVGGAGAGPYVVEGSATYDLRAISATGAEAPGFPKFTGGW
ncbi:MAG: S8 family serine peptidase [Acidimicrobiales bacterium]